MSTHNICLCVEIRKIVFEYPSLSRVMQMEHILSLRAVPLFELFQMLERPIPVCKSSLCLQMISGVSNYLNQKILIFLKFLHNHIFLWISISTY